MMKTDNEEIKLCSFCSTCVTDYQKVADDIKEIITKLSLRHCPLTVNREDPIVCDACKADLRICSYFRRSCSYTEEYVNYFKRLNSETKLDIREVYFEARKPNIGCKRKIFLHKDQTVCRLCLKVMKHDSRVSLGEETIDGVPLRALLDKYFPEIDLEIIEDSAMCLCCYYILRGYFDFMKACSREHGIKTKDNTRCPNEQSNCLHPAVDGLKAENDLEILEMDVKPEQVNIKLEEEILNRSDSQSRANLSMVAGTHNCMKCISTKNTTYSESEALHRCMDCAYTTKRTFSLALHMFFHKSSVHDNTTTTPTMIMMYCRDIPNSDTGNNGNLISHSCCTSQNPRETITQDKDETICKTKGEEPVKNTTTATTYYSEYETESKRRFEVEQEARKKYANVKMYTCEMCSYRTSRRAYIKKHSVTHKNATITPVCDMCRYQAVSEEDSRKHMLVHQNSVEWIQDSCDSNQVNEEASRNDVEETKYLCQFCDYHNSTKIDFDQHISSHRVQSNSGLLHIQPNADICGYQTATERGLQRYESTHDLTRGVLIVNPNNFNGNRAEKPKYRCKICKYEAVFKEDMENHVLVHVGNDKPHKTRNEKGRKREVRFQNHELIRDTITEEKKLTPHSGNDQIMASEKPTRINASVTQESKYHCEICEYEVTSEEDIESHAFLHCRIVVNNRGVAKYQCTSCDFVTVSDRSIKEHILSHSISEVLRSRYMSSKNEAACKGSVDAASGTQVEKCKAESSYEKSFVEFIKGMKH